MCAGIPLDSAYSGTRLKQSVLGTPPRHEEQVLAPDASAAFCYMSAGGWCWCPHDRDGNFARMVPMGLQSLQISNRYKYFSCYTCSSCYTYQYALGRLVDTIARDDLKPDEFSILDEAISRLGGSSALASALAALRDSLSDGVDVVVSPLDEELSPGSVAKVLRMSRPTVYKLVESGDLPARMVGSHHRIRMRDVVAYQTHREAAQCDLAETFAHAEANEAALVRKMAGVDENKARELGF